LKPKFLIFLLLAGVIYIAVLIFGVREQEKTKTETAKVEAMFRLVHPLAGARAQGYRSSQKVGQCVVSDTYSTEANWPEIRAHYDEELARSGWRLVDEEPVLEWNVDKGGRTRHYRNGPYHASLDYFGNRSDIGSTYGLYIKWY
jgi:hypothetical protein